MGDRYANNVHDDAHNLLRPQKGPRYEATTHVAHLSEPVWWRSLLSPETLSALEAHESEARRQSA